MAIKINFDASGNPEEPTLVLSNRSGNKIGQLNAKSIHIKGSQNNPSEISFEVYKYVDRKKDHIWDEIRNFKLVWCKEWDTWFEITVEISEDRTMNARKTVSCTQLSQSELSQIMLYNIEINTENDIARDDYVIPTTLYNAEHPEASLLNRLLEKAPHYSVSHVDSSIAKIQRTFTFDGTSIYDAFQTVAQEIGCLFIFPSNTDQSGRINRTIEVYDLESHCMDCGNRGEFVNNTDLPSRKELNIFNHGDIVGLNPLIDDYYLGTYWKLSDEKIYKTSYYDNSVAYIKFKIDTRIYDKLYFEADVTNYSSSRYKVFQGGLAKESRYGINNPPAIPTIDRNVSCVNYGNQSNYTGTEPWYLMSRVVVEVDLTDFQEDYGYILFHACDLVPNIYSIWLESTNTKDDVIGLNEDVCSKCGSKNINEGYGEDTTIFVTSDELAESDIQFTTDTNSVKNCFKLEAGDDLMTATIRNCNPNGSDYIWYITDEVKRDMSEELVNKLNSYDEKYDYFQKEYVADINLDVIDQYNQLVAKYQKYKPELESIVTPITGYSALMTAYYNTIDLAVYLQSSLMPDVSMSDTNADSQAALLTSNNLSPIAVTNLNSLSLATANNAMLGMAKAIVDSRYQVKVNTSSMSDNIWTGNFIVTNYSDEEDTAVSPEVTVYITDDYETYVKQKLDKSLAKGNSDDVSISGLFKKDYDLFCEELKKYSLNYLKNFYGACQSCIDILIEQGIADSETWYGSSEDLYNVMYVPYYEKLNAIENEIKLRQNELYSVTGTYDTNGLLLSHGVQTYIVNIKNNIQEQLDFQKYLGEDLWLEFCAYRREDKFSNSNYVSDGLDNAELFENALEFLRTASNEIFKSAELQHSISTTLKNLLVIDKFKPLVQYFEVGNWIRVRVDDKIYRLRLIEYEIDYSNLSSISVGFSDVLKVVDGVSDIKDILSKARSMATSYDSVQRQASQGFKGSNTVNDWVENGLDATNTMIIGGADNQTQTWDEHGMLFKRYDDISDSYSDTQLKIINSTISITDDNWETVKTAIGRYYYFDPVSNELKEAYGVNGETIIGKLLLGENLGIYSENNSLTFDRNGLVITNGVNTFAVNPNSDTLLSLSSKDKQLLYATQDGDLVFAGRLYGESGTIGGWTLSSGKLYGGTASSGVSVMQVPVTSDTWVFAAGGKSHEDYSSCPFRVNAAGEVYAKTGIFGNVVSSENGTSGNFDNGFSADSSFGVAGGARTDFDNLVVRNITAENILATNVLADYATITSLNAATARISTIEANYVTTATLTANYATIESLNAVNAKFNSINANNITAGTLSVDRLNISSIVNALSSWNVTVANLNGNSAMFQFINIPYLSSVPPYSIAMGGYFWVEETINGKTYLVKTNVAYSG